jgi:hypothetical protein
VNPFFAEYVGTAKQLASERGLNWDLICDDHGKVRKDTRWNLTELVGMLPPPTLWLGQVGVDPAAFQKLNEIRQRMNQKPLLPGPMSQHWRDLYQAVFVHQLLIRRTKPLSAMQVALGIRRLAPAAEDTPPWAVKPEQTQQAYNAVLQSADSGKLALDFATTVRNILDGQKLADTPALARFCIPYATAESQLAQQQADAIRKRQNAQGGRKSLRRELAERKSASKLPDERAFWELVRIVFLETPRTFSDAIRFAAFKVQIIMGFRIGETAILPLDWKRWRKRALKLQSGVRQKKGFRPVKSMKGATEFQRGSPAGSISNTHGLAFALPKNIPWCNDNPHDHIRFENFEKCPTEKAGNKQ